MQRLQGRVECDNLCDNLRARRSQVQPRERVVEQGIIILRLVQESEETTVDALTLRSLILLFLFVEGFPLCPHITGQLVSIFLLLAVLFSLVGFFLLLKIAASYNIR